MKELFIKYRSVIRFLVIFLGTYAVLGFLYSIYLDLSKDSIYYPDYVTHMVAKQSNGIINSLGYYAEIKPNKNEPSMNLFINGRHLARIIEGCNALSIVILFISFVLAFAQNFKKTLLFIFVGTILIYVVNILRIVILAISIYKYPEYKEILHSVVFPGIIYGMVFLLWIYWVRNLDLQTKIEDEKTV